jgi:hypothetical protein
MTVSANMPKGGTSRDSLSWASAGDTEILLPCLAWAAQSGPNECQA